METTLPMDAPTRLLLYAHIIAGFTALAAGLTALLVRPGSRPHRRAGQVFSYAMAGVVLSAFTLALLRPNAFLFAVGVFSAFMVATGLRALGLKRLHAGQRAAVLDWAILGIGALGAIALITLGIHSYQQAQSPFAAVPVVFGAVMIGQMMADVRRFTRPPAYPLHWLGVHIGRMMGAFIATVTAFSAVNLTFLPPVVQWLWPTLLGSVVIALMRRRYAPGPRRAPTHQPSLRVE